MIKKKIITILIVAAMLFSASGQVLAADFTDIDSSSYKAEINFCQSKGYINGTTATTFNPDGNLTRAQLAVIWCRLLMLHDVNSAFTDISALNNYYDTAAIVMNSLGIISGTSATTFSPGDNVTREQLAVITTRTFSLGVANKDDYKTYTDNALISTWAQDGVSACINAKVFAGLYDGQNFMPKSLVTRGEICKLIYNVSQPGHTVTIGQLSGGTITAQPSVARAGTIIKLLVTPDTGMQLKQGSLMYNGTAVTGTSFIMPAADVIVTADFETIPVPLASIAVTTMPTATAYTVGAALDLTGMVVTATYSDSTTAAVSSYTTTPANASILNTAGAIPITVSYTEGSITKTASFNVQVNAPPA